MRLSVVHRIYFIAVQSNGLVTVFNQPVDLAFQCATLISGLRETVLIGSDRPHRYIDPPADHYRRETRHDSEKIFARIGRRIYSRGLENCGR